MRRLVLLALVLPLLVSCGDDEDAYCGAVKDDQKRLSEIVASGDPDAMLQALGTFEDLAKQAPTDIADEWQQVVDSVESLQDALSDAGVDPATYDRDDPPPGVTAEQRKAIDSAAARVGGAETLQAIKDLDQQARDVCHTPLTL